MTTMPLTRESDPPAPSPAPWPAPDVSHLITEDGKPVDNVFSEKQMRLLTAPLYAAWKPGRPFFAASDVGIFMMAKNPAIAPDVFVALDVEARPVSGPEQLKSYFVWEYGKVPDIVIEIVSNRDGGELDTKLRSYERMHVPNYVVFDPLELLGGAVVTTFMLQGSIYVEQPAPRFAPEGLELTLWRGSFEGTVDRWLRWTELDGRLLPTSEESEARANAAAARADAETARADEARAVAERLRERLRAAGIDPDA